MNMFEGISAGTPDCEVVSQEEEPCVWASFIRLRTECNKCKHVTYRFFCKRHYRGLESGEVVCYHCRSEQVGMRPSLCELTNCGCGARRPGSCPG